MKALLLGAGLAIVLPATAAWSQQTGAPSEVRIDFEQAALGSAPPSFTTALTGRGGPVQWMVIEDASAPAGPKALSETSGDATSDRFPLAILDGLQAKDVEVRIKFKPVSGRVDQAAGLMVRVADADNYYIARANALENNVRLYKVVNGKRQQFAGRDIPVPVGRWQELGLRAEGNRLEVFLDGQSLFSATDDTFAEAGGVGLWTKADSLTHFDGLTLSVLR